MAQAEVHREEVVSSMDRGCGLQSGNQSAQENYREHKTSTIFIPYSSLPLGLPIG